MCGPSSALKAINTSIQDFASTAKSEAGDIYKDASSVFRTIMDSVSGILSGGPSQYGYSAGEQSAKTAAAVNAGAAEARNLKAAAATTGAAIGGGNIALPSGAVTGAVLGAEQKAASDTAGALNQITQEGFATGRDNFFKAQEVAEKAPSVFSTSVEANKGVSEAQKTAMESQQNIDTQSNWAMNDIMKLGTGAITGWATGGFKV